MAPVKLQEILDYFTNKISDKINFEFIENENGSTSPKNVSELQISGFASLEKACLTDISFWTGNAKNITGANGFSTEDLSRCNACVLFVPKKNAEELRKIFPKVKSFISVENPYHAMVSFMEKFVAGGVSAGAVANVSGLLAQIDPTAEIGPGCVIMPGAVIGARCRLEANVVIYPNVFIGNDCVFQAGVVVGSRGFGFYEYKGERRMVPHLAGVRIGNNCSFGANTVVAAGFISPTIIGNDCHFDAMVQIGHNCILGNNIYMAAQTALGGTTIVEDDVNIAGGAKAAGHLTIGRGATITAKAGVTKSVSAGKTVAGFPAIDADVWRRQMVELRVMAKKNLSKKVE